MIVPPPRPTLFPYTTLFPICRGVRRPGHEPPGARAGHAVRDGDRGDGPYHPRELHGQLERPAARSEEHTSELQSHSDLVCRLLLEKKKKKHITCNQRNEQQSV